MPFSKVNIEPKGFSQYNLGDRELVMVQRDVLLYFPTDVKPEPKWNCICVYGKKNDSIKFECIVACVLVLYSNP